MEELLREEIELIQKRAKVRRFARRLSLELKKKRRRYRRLALRLHPQCGACTNKVSMMCTDVKRIVVRRADTKEDYSYMLMDVS